MFPAMAVLETGWTPGMSEEDAKKLVRDAIAAGIINDMGSGSNVDIAVIKPGDDITYFRSAFSHSQGKKVAQMILKGCPGFHYQ